jgi:CBS domain-containing protein
MTPQPVCVDADLKLEKSRRLFNAHGIRQLPVTRFGRVAGVLTEAKVRATRSDPFRERLKVSDVMDVDPYIVGPETNAEEVLRNMKDWKLDYIVVAENEERLKGIFTRQDVLGLLVGPVRFTGKGVLRLIQDRKPLAAA